MSVLRKPVVAVIGTCDTKLAPLSFIKQTINASGSCTAILIDIGTYAPSSPNEIDISNIDVLASVSDDASASSNAPSRSLTLERTTRALTHTLARLRAESAIAGVIAAGGSGNTSVCTKAFHDAPLPIGFPKMMVSTMASGDVGCYVGETDLTMMYSVVDIAGMNDILEVVLGNAARAIAAMALGSQQPSNSRTHKPAIAVTMFGVTTPCVQFVETRLQKLGYDVVVFHATGAGGKAMERLIAAGKFVGVLDLTTTELADELVGGVLSAGPNRLEAAAKTRIPQVVSVGALDMVNFGPRSSVPVKFKERLIVEHNASITLMRTTKEECRELGRILASKVNEADASRTRVILPTKGLSMLSEPGKAFHDAQADNALIQELKGSLRCGIVEVDGAINDQKFADVSVETLLELLAAAG